MTLTTTSQMGGKNSDSISYITYLSKIIAKKQWSSLRKHISTSSAYLILFENNDSLLHQVCKYQPPLSLVNYMVQTNPKLLSMTNSFGHSPLHVAIQNAASPDIIDFLCTSSPEMPGMKDHMGKTPLHMACESYSKSRSKSKSKIDFRSNKKGLRKIIESLIEYSPTTVNLEDVGGITAIEYALDTNTDIKTIHMIQRASQSEWKRKDNCRKNINV